MKTSPVSFGRIVKINAPLNIVQRMADIANQDKKVKDKKERKVQKELKSILYDTSIGCAQAFEVSGDSYIISGVDSIIFSSMKKETDDKINYIKETQHKSTNQDHTEEIASIIHFETAKDILVNELNPKKMSITPDYSFIAEGSESSKDEVRIKSINVIL